jgi:hypothetical protein
LAMKLLRSPSKLQVQLEEEHLGAARCGQGHEHVYAAPRVETAAAAAVSGAGPYSLPILYGLMQYVVSVFLQ